MKILGRRMRRIPRSTRPYRIDISYRVSDEVFTYILKFLPCVTCYGLEIENLKNGGGSFIKVWYKRKMELFLNDLMGKNLPVKTVKGCRLEVVISRERLFTIKYRKTSEKLDISCYYGLWNQYHNICNDICDATELVLSTMSLLDNVKYLIILLI